MIGGSSIKHAENYFECNAKKFRLKILYHYGYHKKIFHSAMTSMTTFLKVTIRHHRTDLVILKIRRIMTRSNLTVRAKLGLDF